MFWRRLVVLVGLGLVACVAVAQEVRHTEAISGSVLRSELRAIENSDKNPLPDLKSAEIGTMVMVSGDFHNSDVLIVTGKGRHSIDDMLSNAKGLAEKLDRTKSDYEVAVGRRLQYVDLSFNDYVDKVEGVSRANLPIGQIMQEVATWNLPQPLALVVENDDDFTVFVGGKVIKETSVYLPNEIRPDDTVVYRVERHWYGLVALIFLCIFMVGMCTYLPLTMFRTIKRSKTEAPKEKPPAATLQEAQERYSLGHQELKNLRKQFKFKHSLFPFFTLLLFPSLPLLKDGFLWIPAGFDSRYMMVFPIIMGLPMVFAALAVRKTQPKEDRDLGDRTFKRMGFLFAPLLVGVVMLPVISFYPNVFRWLPSPYVRPFIYSVLFTPVVIGIFLMVRESRGNRVRLGPGDVDYDVAMEMAREAKVRVSRVEINKELPGVNAAASIFGRVMVTDGLREKMSPAERRAILAHEIGHIKGQHVPILMLVGFAALTILIVLAGQIRNVAENWPSFLKALVNSPLLVWVPQFFISSFLISPIQRRAEFYADRFALEQTRNYSLVATALAKVHLYNGSPHTMTPGHERVASHPSLTKRLDSLRKIAGEMGLAVDDTEVNQIFWGDK